MYKVHTCNFHQSYESSHKQNASIWIPVIVQHHSYLEPRVDTPWNHHFHSRCLLNLKLRQQKSVITLLRTVEKRKRGSETEVGGRGNIAVKKSADITCVVLFVSTQPSPSLPKLAETALSPHLHGMTLHIILVDQNHHSLLHCSSLLWLQAYVKQSCQRSCSFSTGASPGPTTCLHSLALFL